MFATKLYYRLSKVTEELTFAIQCLKVAERFEALELQPTLDFQVQWCALQKT